MNKIINERMFNALAVTVALYGMSAMAEDPAAKPATAVPTKTAAVAVAQASYNSPEYAAKALYDAFETHNIRLIYKVLGPGSEKAIFTGDAVADRQMRERFLAAYNKVLTIERESDTRVNLLLGEKDFPFPFPLVKGPKGWMFDAQAGAEEIVNRRIGENELFAIKACLAYSDAQQEYAEKDRDGDGLIEYAQKFRSSEGKRDGLYWPTAEKEPLSPLGPLAAQVTSEGYSVKEANPPPLYGYFYRILTGQGKDAPGGAYEYMFNGNMIGGYAMVAYPVRWGASGVMTFVCNHDGVVYQKNLGETTAEIASKMTHYNPDASWKKAE